MASLVWPIELPSLPAWDNTESGDDNVIRGSNAGPAKMRRRYTAAVQRIGWPSVMTDAQVSRLRTFYDDEAKAVLPFNITHPQTGIEVEARFAKRWSTTNIAPNAYRVDIELEILP